VRLVPLSAAHLPEAERLFGDPDVLRFTLAPDPPDPAFARRWLDRYEQARPEGTREAFAAVGDDGAFLGLALVPRLDRSAGEAELGYIVAPAARGRGVATELLRVLTDWVFACGIQRVELRIHVDNPASLRVAERAGFRREGVRRSSAFKQGRRCDFAIYSRLPTDTGLEARRHDD
jgi:RimJ/RimL family protein N-acetyltransferase